MTLTRIQPVINRPGENALFIVLGLKQGAEVVDTVIDFAANFSALTRSLSNRYPDEQFSAVLGFGARAWDCLFQITLSHKN